MYCINALLLLIKLIYKVVRCVSQYMFTSVGIWMYCINALLLLIKLIYKVVRLKIVILIFVLRGIFR
jgi:hypothetical protein